MIRHNPDTEILSDLDPDHFFNCGTGGIQQILPITHKVFDKFL